MIAANELRIGSLINYEQTTHIITEISKTLVRHYWVKNQKDEYVSDFSEISPIPLSPEILEKCGIKDVWIKNSWKVVEDVSGGETFGWGMKVRNANYNKEIEFAYFKSLHQLQNLIFALTGTELEIKL